MDAAPASVAAAGGPVVAARPDPSPLIERVFRAIEAERMRGLPFVNPALSVEAVGFRRWEGRWLGVLITPWFMNLMLLPDAPAAWRTVRRGDYAGYALPSGVYEFLGAHEPALGDYQSCSLFSPVFEFADQAGARATAVAVLQALFDPAARAGLQGPGTTPAGPAADESVAHESAAHESLAHEPAAPVSKRNFLRGRWSPR